MQSAPDASGSTSDSTSTPNENSSLRRFSIGAAGEMTISRNGNASTLRLIDTLLRNPIVREIAAPQTSPNSPDAPTTPSVIDTSGNRQEVPSTPRGGTPPQIIEDEDTRASETENSPLSNTLAEQWSRRPIFIANINEDTNPPPSFQSMAPLGLQPIESTEDELARVNQPDSSSDSDDSYSSMPPLEEIDQSSQQTPSPSELTFGNLSIPIGSGVTDERLENFVRQLMVRHNVTDTGGRIPREVLDRFRQSTIGRIEIVRALDAHVFGQTAEADLPLSTPESSDSDSESNSEAPTDVIVEQDNRAPRRNRYNNHDLL